MVPARKQEGAAARSWTYTAARLLAGLHTVNGAGCVTAATSLFSSFAGMSL